MRLGWQAVLCLPALPVLGTSAFGQDLLRTHLGPPFGRLASVSSVGDLNNDGFPEYVLGTYGDVGLQNGAAYGGRITLHDGLTGMVLRTHLGMTNTGGVNSVGTLGVSVFGVQDYDGDGTPDYLATDPSNGGAPFEGLIAVWSGATGQRLAMRRGCPWGDFGTHVKPLGDLDGDGKSEILNLYRYGTNCWDDTVPDYYADVRSGGDLGVDLRMLHRAHSAVSIDDIDGDGVRDLILGRLYNYGNVHAVSGASGEILWRVQGAYIGQNIGVGMALLDDRNQDGFPELAVGYLDSWATDNNCNSWTIWQTPDQVGGIIILSGIDGTWLESHSGPRNAQFLLGNPCSFEGMISGPDVNGDGYQDLLVSAPSAGLGLDLTIDCPNGGDQGFAYLYSGKTLALLWREYPAFSGHGENLAILGDLDGDGLSEWAVGWLTASCNASQQGRVRIFKGSPGDAERLCIALPNSTGTPARIQLDGPISVGDNALTLLVEDCPPGELGFFFYGPDLVSQPLGDGVLCVGGAPGTALRIGPGVLIDAAGLATQPVDFTREPFVGGPHAWIPGSTWTVQFAYRDPQGPLGTGFNYSDAMRVTFPE